MPQPQPAPQCPHKHGLTEDIRLAMNTIISLNNREMEAVIAGDFEKVKGIEEELVQAREWKDSLVERYRRHVQEHGC